MVNVLLITMGVPIFFIQISYFWIKTIVIFIIVFLCFFSFVIVTSFLIGYRKEIMLADKSSFKVDSFKINL